MSSHRSVISELSRPRLLLPALVAAAAVLCGCWVTVLSGPVLVSIGQTVTYVVEIENDNPDGVVPELLAEVPEGWLLESVTYEGTVNGEPVAGDGVAVQSQTCNDVLGALRPGFRRWHLEPSLELEGVGSGTATLEFVVDSQPPGEFDLLFVFGGFGGAPGACSAPAAITINPQGPAFLTLLQTLFDDSPEADGLGGGSDVEASPDGRHLYVAAEVDQAVAVFARDSESGELTFVEAEFEGAGGVEGLGRFLALSPDGRHLYAGGAAFSRDPASGELGFLSRFSAFDGSLVLSPDGRHLYLSRELGIDVYARDGASGELTLLDTVPQGDLGGRATFSPDGRHLYVVDPDDLRLYNRDGTSGELTLHQTYVNDGNIEVLAASPDGDHLYAATERTLAVIERDPILGFIEFTQVVDQVLTESVAVSPDGTHVVAAGRGGAHVFRRFGPRGRLTRVESQLPGVGGLPVAGLEGPAALAFAPDSRRLYALSPSDDALLAFSTAILFSDGFESGNTTAWSTTVP